MSDNDETTQTKHQRDLMGQAVANMGLITPLSAPAAVPEAPEPNETWPLDAGQAWVYCGAGHTGLVRPVVLSDGFDSGPSSIDHIWDSWNGAEQYPFFDTLLAQGRDLVIVGYSERSASILDNANVVIAAVNKTIASRTGDAPLTVGGYSMGGLITRYALAKMEHDNTPHETTTYFSYDTPHLGAWIPISVQAFAHFTKGFNADFSNQINSPAARQMLWRHIATADDTPAEDPMRTAFLAELARVGQWPSQPRKVGVSNGAGDGKGNGDTASAEALRSLGPWFKDTVLNIQASGDNRQVADLHALLMEKQVTTSGLPEVDGAPGGMLNPFQLIADALNKLSDGNAQLDFPDACFIPAISAVALRDVDLGEDLYVPANDRTGHSELDEFLCATQNEGHIAMTPELGGWLLSQLPV